jgi:hypothetical protein
MNNNENEWRKDFIVKEYSGSIKKIMKVKANHGYPAILLNGQMILLGKFWDKVVNHLQEGDSIVKEPGTLIFKVYRKNLEGEWDEKIYK